MAIHFAPMGSRGEEEYVSHSDLENYMENTAIDLYLSFGLRTDTDTSRYISTINTLLNGGEDGVIDDSPIKLIIELQEAALDDLTGQNPDYDKIDAIANAFSSHSKVGGFFIEEPNLNDRWPASTVVNRAQTRLGGTKPLIVDIYRSGADQSVYNSYASYCDYLAGYYYPHPQGSWTNIEDIVDTNMPLYYMKNATPATPFYFCVEVKDSDDSEMPSEAEINWMTHRSLVYGASGIFFYNWLRRKTAGDSEDVKSVCENISDVNLPYILSQTNKDSLVSGSMSYVAFSYRQSDSDYYLLVVDDDPETTGSRSFVADCDLENLFNYFDHCEEIYHNPGTSVTVHDAGGTKKRLSGSVNQGQVKLYRFFINI